LIFNFKGSKKSLAIVKDKTNKYAFEDFYVICHNTDVSSNSTIFYMKRKYCMLYRQIKIQVK